MNSQLDKVFSCPRDWEELAVQIHFASSCIAFSIVEKPNANGHITSSINTINKKNKKNKNYLIICVTSGAKLAVGWEILHGLHGHSTV